ncbi:MAG: CBS domain-containing protein, partial [Alphaproteobacteria bacterium]
MRTPPVAVADDTDVAGLLGRMAAAKATSALIVDSDGRLTGIITEQDVTRRIALRCAGTESVRSVMTTPVETVADDDYLYAAIARMRRFDWRHMPVVDADNKPVGTIVLDDA